MEWWGENAFFSRDLTCRDHQLSAIDCLTWGSGVSGYCIWCQDGCQTLLDPFCYQGQYATHYDGPDPSDVVLEGSEIVLNLNQYVVLYREANVTNEADEVSTSDYLAISAIFSPTTTGCTLSLSGNDLTVTVKDEYVGVCKVRIDFYPRSDYGSLGLPLSRTRVVVWYTITSNQQNDAPEQNSAKTAAIFANFSLVEDDTNSGKINGCDLFEDKDGDIFTLSFSTSDPVLVVTAASCSCPTGCPLTFETDSVDDDTDVVVTFTADDGNGGVGTFDQTIKVANIKYTPTVSSPISTVVLNEEPDEETTVELSAHFEIEDDSPLTYNMEVPPTLVSYDLDSETGSLKFTSAGVLWGSEIVTVSASSDERKAFIKFNLTVVSQNDAPVVVKDSETYTQNAGTSLTVALSTFVTDEDGDNLICGPQVDTYANVTFGNNGNMTIFFLKKTTEASAFDIICRDAANVEASFKLEISVTLANRPPQIIKNFVQIKISPSDNPEYDLKVYFSDPDLTLGDSLSYTVSTDNSLLGWEISGDVLKVIPAANAAGVYTLSVTAKDLGGSTVTQAFPFLVYRNVNCSEFTKSWSPVSPLTINFSTECNYFLPFTLDFHELQEAGSLYADINSTLNGTNLVLQHTSGCSGGGRYNGIVTLTDGYTTVNRTLTVTVNPTNTLVTAKQTYWYALVSQVTGNKTYDGEVLVSGASAVRINLNDVVQSCAQVTQALTFTNTSSIDGQFLDLSKGSTMGAIGGVFGRDNYGYYLSLKNNPNGSYKGPAALVRAFDLSFGVRVADPKGSSVTFTLRITKSSNSSNMTGNATGNATGNS